MTPTAAALPESVRTRSRVWPLRREHGALAGILVLSGLLEFVKLAQNGYANIYYSAAVKSMLRSLHNFFFVSADPNGLITVDKPPLALWLEALSAKVFGFHPLSLLIPEGICAVVAVAVIYWVVAPRFGVTAGLISAFTLAVFPSFVAVSRDNGVDPLLILLMLCACWAGLTAIETGRLWRLLLCALIVGLAFNTKALAALLCVPGIGVAYLICAPVSLRRRVLQLTVAGVAMVVVCASWSAAVDLTPASQRPFVGSTFKNTETQLIFGYNGFGRVGGQQGGPNDTHRTPAAAQPPLVRPGIDTRLSVSAIDTAYIHARSHAHRAPRSATPTMPTQPTATGSSPAHHGRPRAGVVPFASSTLSPVRIFGKGLGDQAGWDVPLAVLGAIALLVVLVRRRRDRAFAALLVLGGWFLIEMLTLDFSKGIVHPYYSSAL
ncbi:MAG TPA: glycosyltransferase family 39 protein, partial [Candidatus Aquilonibacter sp.]|nr:glycosyltransferase family 39 protein [Candidatus Aquilonibacter sp.]